MEKQYEVQIGDEKFQIGKKSLQTIMRNSILTGVIASSAIEGEVVTEKEIDILFAMTPPESIPDSFLVTQPT